MEIIPRQPVAGENPNRRFVGIVDDSCERFFPCNQPITSDLQLRDMAFHGRFNVYYDDELRLRLANLKRMMDDVHRRVKEDKKIFADASPLKQSPRAMSILVFDAQLRAQGHIPIYDEGGGIVASYPADPNTKVH